MHMNTYLHINAFEQQLNIQIFLFFLYHYKDRMQRFLILLMCFLFGKFGKFLSVKV